MKYISHLDLVRLFYRASRRAKLPICITKGFSPHPKISFGRALKLGEESKQEEAILWLESKIDEKQLLDKLNQQLPEGLYIFQTEEQVCIKKY